jgi:hypothetical protein
MSDYEIIVESASGYRRAVLSDGPDGVEARYYRRLWSGGWLQTRRSTIALPMHAARDLAHQIVNQGGSGK